jgi:MFS family permease
VLGAGLAIIRLSALAALPLAALADRFGRRRTLLTWATVGLVVVVAAAASPGYWWFVGAFAVARAPLSATSTVGQVTAAEHTPASDRAKAVALISAAYGVGAGAVAVVRAGFGSALGFRGVFALSGLALGLVWAASRRVTEPSRYARGAAQRGPGPHPALGAVPAALRGRLTVLGGLAFATGLVTGPVNTFLFVYGENVLGVSSAVTGGLVVAAGLVGLSGLVVGRLLADQVGRRPAGAAALVVLCGAGVLAYSGSVGGLAAGYLLGVLAGSAYSTPAITLTNELFPTSARGSVSGWLVVAGTLGSTAGLLLVGAIADASGSFGAATAVVCAPAAVCAALVLLLPETRGLELEESAKRSLGRPTRGVTR